MKAAVMPSIVATALLALPLAAPAAGLYKWVDEEGVVHYSQTPPAGRKAEELHLRLPPTPARPPPRSAPPERAAADAAPAAADGGGGEDDPEFRRKACAWARSELAGTESANRVYRTDAEGNPVRLSEEERQARIAELRAKVDEYCR